MLAGLAAVLAVVVVGGGLALRFGVYPGGGSVTQGPPGFRTFTGSGIAFDFPDSWELRDASTAFSGGSAIAVAGTLPVDPACGIGHVDINCYYERKLDPGTISVVIGTGAFPDGTIFDPARAEPPTVRTVVAGMPSLFTDGGHVEGNYYEADLQLDWQIANPTLVSNLYTVSVGIRGPGVEEMRAQAVALVASLRFTNPPTPLPDDPALTAAAGRAAIEEAEAGDRQMWAVGPEVASWYSCFGEESEQSSFVRVETTPGGLLDPPLLVECTWSIEPEDTSFWRLDLVTRWPADDPVHTVRETRWLTAHGTLAGTSLEGDFPPTTDAADPTVSPTAPDPTPGSLAPEFTGTAWRAVSIAGQSVSEPAVPRIEFDWLGRPNGWGFTGCDEFGFGVSFDGGRVAVGSQVLDPSGCNGPGAETKHVFLDAFQTAERWFLEEDRLTLTGPRGDVVFARDLPPPGDPGRFLAEALHLGTWRIVEAPGVPGLEHLSPLRFADRLLIGAGECGFSSDIQFGSGVPCPSSSSAGTRSHAPGTPTDVRSSRRFSKRSSRGSSTRMERSPSQARWERSSSHRPRTFRWCWTATWASSWRSTTRPAC